MSSPLDQRPCWACTAGRAALPAILPLTCSRRSAAESPPAFCTGAWACSGRGQGDAQRGWCLCRRRLVCNGCTLQSVNLPESEAELHCPAGPASPQAVPRLEAAPGVGALAIPARSKGNCCFIRAQPVGPWLAKVPGSRDVAELPSGAVCCRLTHKCSRCSDWSVAMAATKQRQMEGGVDQPCWHFFHTLLVHTSARNLASWLNPAERRPSPACAMRNSQPPHPQCSTKSRPSTRAARS